MANSGLHALYPDNTGKVWFSTTLGDGLIAFDPNTEQVSQYNREDGLLSDYISHIKPYEGKLYLATQYGYSAFDLRTHDITSTSWIDIPGDYEMTIDTTRGWMVATGFL
jgi:hypothetical protein